MAQIARVDYDQENDIFYVYTGEKVRDSLEVGKFVIDFSSENKIVGLEIIDFSSYLDKVLNIQIARGELSEIKQARFSVNHNYSKELVFITVFVPLRINNEIREVPIQVQPPAVAMEA